MEKVKTVKGCPGKNDVQFLSREVLLVVIRNVEVDAEFCEGLCNLYKESEEVFCDEIIDEILIKGLLSAWKFDVISKERRHNTMVRACLEAGLVSTAQYMLSENCDQETFTTVLMSSCERSPFIARKLDLMKRMGYKREFAVFEKCIPFLHTLEALKTLFREMVEEYPKMTAKAEVYGKSLRYADESFTNFVIEEAASKSVTLSVTEFEWGSLKRLSFDHLKRIVTFTEAAIYGHLFSACRKCEHLAFVVKQARSHGVDLDPVSLTRVFLSFNCEDVCANAESVFREGCVLDDRASHYQENQKSLVKLQKLGKLFEAATRVTSQPLPEILEFFLESYWLHHTDAMALYQAFWNLKKPDESICRKIITRLRESSMDEEAMIVTKMFPLEQ